MRPPSIMAHPRDKPTTSTPSLYSRLLFADETSLSILGGGTAALEEFREYWIDLQDSLQDAITNGTASEEILALAYKVARRTEYITDKLITLYEEVESLNASFSDLRTLFHDLSLEDKPSVKISAKQDPTKAFPLPAYIKPAYEWLLANLHNPYPSKDVKRTISAETNTSVPYIENWFTDVRRKIGWTTLSKERFHNKRSLIVEAAIRTFHPVSAIFRSSDVCALASTSEDFTSTFHQIQDNAKNLYVDKLYETNLALKVVEPASADLTPLTRRRSRNLRLNSTFSPSPSSSHSSPQPEESFQGSSPKRRSTCSPDAGDAWPRSHKRTRYASPQETVCDTPISVPSPSLSAVEIRSTVAEASPRPTRPIPPLSSAGQGKRKRQASDEADLTELPILSTIRENSTPISVKRKRVSSGSDGAPTTPTAASSVPFEITPSHPPTRKRRLSDATVERASKRPHTAPSAPRLQTVSDPYPMRKPVNPPSEFDLWWSSSITSGQPITLAPPEPVAIEPIVLDNSTIPVDITWNSGVVIPPIAPAFKEKSWMELLQGGVDEIDSIFTNFLDPEAFEQHFNADLFSQADIGQNLLGFESTNNLPVPTNFVPTNFQNLGFASSQPDLNVLAQFVNPDLSFSLPNPTQLLQSLHESAMAPAQYDCDMVSFLEDKSTKAAKIQRLREELMRLEAEAV